MEREMAKEKEGVFGNPEVNAVKRDNNRLKAEIDSLKKEKNSKKMKEYERANFLKAVALLAICLGCLVYVLWLR
jgi:hypothetical protein